MRASRTPIRSCRDFIQHREREETVGARSTGHEMGEIGLRRNPIATLSARAAEENRFARHDSVERSLGRASRHPGIR